MKKLLVSLGVIAIGLFVGLGVVQAAKQDRSELAVGENHRGLYARAAETVVVAGDIDGDVWLAGSKVEVTGSVNGNIYAAGEEVVIKGPVTGSVHAAGSRVRIEGHIDGTVYAAGSQVETTDSFRSGHAAVLAGDRVTVGGQVIDQLYVAGSQVTLQGTIGQSARVEASELKVTSDASIVGDLRYNTDGDPEIANDRAIQGQVVRDDSLRQAAKENEMRGRFTTILLGLSWNIVLAAILLYLAPRFFQQATQVYEKSPMHHTLKALGFVVLVPVGIIFGFITIIGVPAMVLALLAYIAVILVAPIAVSYFLGQKISAQTAKASKPSTSYRSQLLATVMGLVVFTVLTIIPVLGGILGSLLYLIGIGVILSRGFAPLRGTAKALPKTKALAA